MNDMWFTEDPDGIIDPKYTRLQLKIKKTLYSGKSKYQKLDFYETYDHGILFALDNCVMMTSKDEFIYHEMLTHILLFTHPTPEKVLVIGGGDGGALREVVKHPEVQEAHLCEIDKMVVEKCREFLPYYDGILDLPRVKVFYEDGFNFLENRPDYYDLILVDSTDPMGEAVKLFKTPFIKLCHKSLKNAGMMSMQCGSPFYQTDFIKNLKIKMESIFPISRVYTACVHSYPGGYWGFLMGSKEYDPGKHFQKERYNQSNLDLGYYNDEIHRASFALPSYLKKATL